MPHTIYRMICTATTTTTTAALCVLHTRYSSRASCPRVFGITHGAQVQVERHTLGITLTIFVKYFSALLLLCVLVAWM